ncbi:MAG: hypothetical protein OHK0028_22900 [Deltaproteobacteria bacterium]
MIRAMIFDLDGTLVKTERMKAISCARAAMELFPGGIREEDVLEAFKEVVGLSHEEVATFLMRRFGLEESARSRMRGLGVGTPWEAFAAVRAPIHAKMLEDPEIYLLVARKLGVPPVECLVVEDSPAGVKAARAAGMWCIAVATPFTRERLHAGRLLEERWIVDDPAALPSVVRRMIGERKEDAKNSTGETRGK